MPPVRPFVEGIVAGLGIAVPVGPIAVLLIDLAIRRGFRPAVPAALGTASADLTYATIAALAGLAAAAVLQPYATELRIVSAVVVGTIAVYRTWRLLRGNDGREAGRGAADGAVRTYLAFLGLTLLNPLTITYFAALILGLGTNSLRGTAAKSLFVVGAFVASAAWQLVLVASGALFHHRLSDRARFATGMVGNLVIAAMAVRILASL